jgi:glycosyltransferase involved in cell wall biosynthesis
MPPESIAPRVLHVDDQDTWRGGEQQMFYLARGLAERGIWTAMALQPNGPAETRARRAGLPVYRIAMHGEWDVMAAMAIARTARAGGFNILHAHTAHAQSLIMLARFPGLAPCRLVAHRRIEFPVGKGLLGLGRIKYRLGVDAYVAVSNRVKETLLRARVPEWRVFPVHTVTNPERFRDVRADAGLRASLGIPRDAFVIGNIAALVEHKDHRTLLEACRIVRDRVPQTYVVIVGEGPLRQRVLAKAEALQMADRLVMTGFRQDIPQLIGAFDAFALSSTEEGLSGTLLEVAASGCPIVTTDAGGAREAILHEQSGIVVPPGSPKALASGLLRLHDEPDTARAFAERGLERVRAHFTPDQLTEQTIRVYERVLAGCVGPEHPVGFCEV